MDEAAPRAAGGTTASENELAQVSEDLKALRMVYGDVYEFGRDEQGYWAERLDDPGAGRLRADTRDALAELVTSDDIARGPS
jgi:hypothetical protein